MVFKTKKERLKLKYQKDEDDGYKYAAVVLLQGKSPVEVYSYVDCAIYFGDYSHFEIGMM